MAEDKDSALDIVRQLSGELFKNGNRDILLPFGQPR